MLQKANCLGIYYYENRKQQFSEFQGTNVAAFLKIIKESSKNTKE